MVGDHLNGRYPLPQRLNAYIYPDTSAASTASLSYLQSSCLLKTTINGSKCGAVWCDMANVFLRAVLDIYNMPLCYCLSLHCKQSARQ